MNKCTRLTHSDAVHLRLVSFVVVPVHRILANYKSCSDGNGKLVWTIRGRREDLIDVVHRRDDRGKTRSSTGKEQCSVFENLEITG
jgi:hypothetical protein